MHMKKDCAGKGKLVSRMMFVKENAKLPCKHDCALAKQEMESHLHHLIELELEYRPPLKEQEEMDVGNGDCHLEF
jgi:hypothetical protein